MWETNNLACLKTWIHLKVLNEHDEDFTDTGILQIGELSFWKHTGDPELHKLNVSTLCHQLDSMFRLFDKATYKEHSSIETAISAMYSIIIDPQKTIEDLSEIIEQNYHF